ncbi:LemA family protein [[Eubacterium] hominis]|uniref:LemA family protein n=1 Tax=[Eubacterium] hominis TaxID=2764325 RepID=UPI003A4D89CF
MAGIVIAVIVVLIIIWMITTYNKFIKLQNKVEEGFSTMDVYLKKRYDLIPNLVESIKGYAKHESETLTKVISARNMAVQAQTLDEKIQGEKNFQSMLGPLYAISEQYPDLKADQNFMDLQNQLKMMEGEIANARKYYNAVCVKFNNLVEMFPSNLLAGIFHFAKKPLYEVQDASERENVKVQF